MVFIGKMSKGHNSVENGGGVPVLFLCTSSDSGLCPVELQWLEH